MDTRDSRTQRLLSELEERLLSEVEEEYLARDGRRPRISRGISRRELLRSSAGTAVVSAVGMAGLLELLANREAFAAGDVFAIVGVTRAAAAHRHTFAVRFVLTDPATLMGQVSGRTEAVVLETNDAPQHWHRIGPEIVTLQQVIPSGGVNDNPASHKHDVSIE